MKLSNDYLRGWNDGKREQSLLNKNRSKKNNGNMRLSSIASLIISLIVIFIFNFSFQDAIIITFISALILNEFQKEYAQDKENAQ